MVMSAFWAHPAAATTRNMAASRVGRIGGLYGTRIHFRPGQPAIDCRLPPFKETR
jgi:hypothetical protein